VNRTPVVIALGILLAGALVGSAVSQVIIGPDGVMRRAPGAPGGPPTSQPLEMGANPFGPVAMGAASRPDRHGPIKLTPAQQEKLRKLGELGMIPIPPGPDGMTPEMIEMLWKMKDNPPWQQHPGVNPLAGPLGGGGGFPMAAAMATTTSANFRATWSKSPNQPAKVSLFNKDGEAIFTDAPAGQLADLIAKHKLDAEAQQLLKQQPRLDPINPPGGNPFVVHPE
jgi:hypothetical protein